MASSSRRARGVGEHDRPELRAVDGAVRVEHVGAEARGNRLRGLGARRRHAVGQLVGVEARHAAAAKLRRARSSCRWRCRRSVRLFSIVVGRPSAGTRCRMLRARRAACSSAASQSSAARRRRAPASARRRPPRPRDGRRRPPASRGARRPRGASIPAANRRSTTARSLTRRRADVDDRGARLHEVARDERRAGRAPRRECRPRARRRGRSAVRE